MELILLTVFAAIALVMEAISAFSDSFIFPALAGMIFLLLGLSLMTGGVDITYTASYFNATSSNTAVAQKTVNYYDASYINTIGIAILLLGMVSVYGSYLRTRDDD